LVEEIRVWGRLQNEHILPVLGHVYWHGHLPSLVFPWMENGSLTNFLDKYETLERGERFRLVSSSGYNGIHVQTNSLHVIAVVHGDLTGDNILVDSHGRAFVTGVGLSKRLNEFTSNPGSGMGDTRSAAIRWMAPELVDDEEIFPTSKSDVWSFGCNMIHVHHRHIQAYIMYLTTIPGALWAVTLVVVKISIRQSCHPFTCKTGTTATTSNSGSGFILPPKMLFFFARRPPFRRSDANLCTRNTKDGNTADCGSCGGRSAE
ncbi:kinase-like domain-containing protein, partial [Suillus subluteus]